MHMLGHDDEREQREVAPRDRMGHRTECDPGKLRIDEERPPVAGREREFSRLTREIESTEPFQVLGLCHWESVGP